MRAKAREGEVRESCTRHAVQHELPQARSLPERELPRLCSLGRAGVRAMDGTDMEQNEVATFQRSIAECGDPVEIARQVKLAFKKMPGEMALACFAKVMTAELPHPIKVAVWDAVRYSHIWWGVEEVLKGDVMSNPLVQQAFADAVPMRRWIVDNKHPGYEPIQFTLSKSGSIPLGRWGYALIPHIVHGEDEEAASVIAREQCEWMRDQLVSFVDMHGNNLLWYLTYRDDQQAQGGFACPCIERELLRLGVDPNHRNNVGLCWNDVRRHLNRPLEKI